MFRNMNIKKPVSVIMVLLMPAVFLCGCTKQKNNDVKTYSLKSFHAVDGRQGVAYENGCYYVSGSATLTKYDKDWNVIKENKEPFSKGYALEVNHIGDIDVYNNEIYCGVELFLDGAADNIQIAVYDADTLELKRTFNFEKKSGQTECSGIAVNPDNKTVWMCSWADGESGRYLYKYDLESGDYLGKIHLHAVPQWIQGVAYFDGAYYITADDGDADFDEPDHVYKAVIEENATQCRIIEEKSLDDVERQGEIEGLTFNRDTNQMLVLYNRGARIILGMPSGFYDGYKTELHEVYVYDVK